MLTDENISERKIKRILTRLYKILGTGYETSVEHNKIGFDEFVINKLVKEMPWNYKKIKVAIEKFYKDMYEAFSENDDESYEDYCDKPVDVSEDLETLVAQEFEFDWDFIVSLRFAFDAFFKGNPVCRFITDSMEFIRESIDMIKMKFMKN